MLRSSEDAGRAQIFKGNYCQVSPLYGKASLARVALGDTNDDLHYCAIAAQLLCTGLLSYAQSHIGAIDPFFLDTAQERIILIGTQLDPGKFIITAELYELDCLASMTHQRVFAFSSYKSESTDSVGLFHVRTTHDFLDTWGPGFYIHDEKEPEKLRALQARSGYIYRRSAARHFHWDSKTLPPRDLTRSFDVNGLMMIGASSSAAATAVTSAGLPLNNVQIAANTITNSLQNLGVNVNCACRLNEQACRNRSGPFLHRLDTYPHAWRSTERSYGMQVSPPYVAVTATQTQTLILGTTLKGVALNMGDTDLIDFLEEYWGLQISLYTNVARRVTLRELVADLLPVFVDRTDQTTWKDLEANHQPRDNLQHVHDLHEWIGGLPADHRLYLRKQIRAILKTLSHTGYYDQGKEFIVAWPRQGDSWQGFTIDCSQNTCMRVFADATDCTTFAYITPLCLTTNIIACKNPTPTQPVLQPDSRLVGTRVGSDESHPDRNFWSRMLHLSTVSASGTPSSLQLKPGDAYHIRKMDKLLVVRVVPKPSTNANDGIHLVVSDSIIADPGRVKRLLGLGKKRCIREQRLDHDSMINVVIRAHD